MLTSLLASSLCLATACHNTGMATPEDAELSAKTIYDFKLPDIDGHKTSLGKFKGKVLLVVNVASKCGLTPQYKALEALYQEYKPKGLVILGFPANNFKEQEPGTNAEIKQFCTANYGVTFPMFSKISVGGDDQADIYKWLIENSARPTEPIEWNFAKFVIGKKGTVVARLKPQDTPDSEAVRKAIDAALAE